jgi:hypothetical protein
MQHAMYEFEAECPRCHRRAKFAFRDESPASTTLQARVRELEAQLANGLHFVRVAIKHNELDEGAAYALGSWAGIVERIISTQPAAPAAPADAQAAPSVGYLCNGCGRFRKGPGDGHKCPPPLAR